LVGFDDNKHITKKNTLYGRECQPDVARVYNATANGIFIITSDITGESELIQIFNLILIKSQISALVCTTCFRNNLSSGILKISEY
jgi:hypothetical protein